MEITTTQDSPAADSGADVTRLAHGLRWGIKASFLDYVRRMPDGQGSVGDGAVPVGSGELFYEYDADGSSPDVWSFRGDVRFSGHYGMLFVRVAHPTIELVGDRAVLTIEDPQARDGAPRVPLVTGTLQRVADQAPTVVWGSDNVTLTAAGVELFNDVYAEGEAFEPFVVQLPAGS
ncbi:hypothetical protein GCM10009798_04340 [Nocardioides panacihumi]|uniref:Htaa domain-containing protein n=1 Tax=Nocardioides panacihumi TaxID=400774 RepID=A0ABN2QAE0_9ACTN